MSSEMYLEMACNWHCVVGVIAGLTIPIGGETQLLLSPLQRLDLLIPQRGRSISWICKNDPVVTASSFKSGFEHQVVPLRLQVQLMCHLFLDVFPWNASPFEGPQSEKQLRFVYLKDLCERHD